MKEQCHGDTNCRNITRFIHHTKEWAKGPTGTYAAGQLSDNAENLGYSTISPFLTLSRFSSVVSNELQDGALKEVEPNFAAKYFAILLRMLTIWIFFSTHTPVSRDVSCFFSDPPAKCCRPNTILKHVTIFLVRIKINSSFIHNSKPCIDYSIDNASTSTLNERFLGH